MDGLEKFREAFTDYTDNYVIIGGTACELNMADTVVRARATHDVDMMVIVENMTAAFARRFWQFVRDAGYRHHPVYSLGLHSFGRSLLHGECSNRFPSNSI